MVFWETVIDDELTLSSKVLMYEICPVLEKIVLADDMAYKLL